MSSLLPFRSFLPATHRGWLNFVPLIGPAVVASIGYLDPGNFATNIQAGSAYGYRLLWVVVVANAIAMLFQSMSAKIGIVTGRNLPELCRMHFGRKPVWAMWLASEVAAMATDLAEFLGGALAFSMLMQVSMMAGMVMTAVLTYAILSLQKHGLRAIEIVIGSLVLVIGFSLIGELFILPQDWGSIAHHALVPEIGDRAALTVAVGMIGATIMPHTLYLHSGLMQSQPTQSPHTQAAYSEPTDFLPARRKRIKWSNLEVMVALGFAGLINMALLAMASAGFHAHAPQTADIDIAYRLLHTTMGSYAAQAFLLALLASGVASSVVGTMAGQVIMQGFVSVKIPMLARRVVTAAPAFAIVAMGWDITRLMILSQVVLSLVLPLPMIALLRLSSREDIMGPFVTRRGVGWIACVSTAVIVALNVYLVVDVMH